MSTITSTTQITALLVAAGNAHHQYEQTVLKGVYDQDWPEWYARYCLEQGLNTLLTQTLTLEECRDFFQQSYQAFQLAQARNWADYTARQLVADYGGGS